MNFWDLVLDVLCLQGWKLKSICRTVLVGIIVKYAWLIVWHIELLLLCILERSNSFEIKILPDWRRTLRFRNVHVISTSAFYFGNLYILIWIPTVYVHTSIPRLIQHHSQQLVILRGYLYDLSTARHRVSASVAAHHVNFIIEVFSKLYSLTFVHIFYN